jgi:hypothetical protein
VAYDQAEVPEGVQEAVRAAYSDASQFIDDEIAPLREKAFSYFDGYVWNRAGKPEMPDDLEGRSSIVMREVADTIQQMLPGLIRVFTSGEQVVQFVPNGPEDEALAEQQTDYVNHVMNSDGNSFFVLLHDALHDALLKKTGVLMWYWDERVTVDEMTFTGLTPFQAARLEQDPEIEVLERTETFAAPLASPPPSEAAGGMSPSAALPPFGQMAAAPGVNPSLAPGAPFAEPTIDMRVRRRRTRGALRVEAVPPEEFVIARDARDVPTTPYCARRRLPTVSELVEAGYDREAVERHAREDIEFGLNEEAEQRNPGLRERVSGSPRDRSQWRVLYAEHYIRFDSDDDGVAELHRVCTVGEQCEEVLHDEIVPEAPFAVFSPVRLPHAVFGYSVADQVIDLQDLKTQIMRSVLDSLAESLDPKMGVVENAVRMEDVLNNERGAVIRMSAPGMVQPFAMPFVGPQAMGVMAYLDEVRAQRTGITRASQGLDPEILQSTTKAAVQNTVEAAQERVEMIARTIAETGVKALFRGVLRAIIRHQDKPRVVRLRNQWIEVDPRAWDAEMDVSVNVGLGRGTDEQKMGFLGQIVQKQEQILATLGPGNPLVDLRQLRSTYAEMLRLAGYKDASRFFREIDQAAMQQMAQASQQRQPPMDPNMMLAQVEAQKAQIDMQIAREKMQLEWLKAQQADDRERDRTEADIALRAAEMQAKYGAQVDMAAIKASIDRDRNLMQMQAQQQRDAMQMQQRREQAAMQSQQQGAVQ